MGAGDEAGGPVTTGAGPDPTPDLGRAAATVSAVNLVSRLTGFGRVVATGAALGISALGDTYQQASVVSNVLFELLAGGLLFAVLVPVFVARLTDGDRDGARGLAGVLVGRAAVGLGAVVVVGVVAAPLVARLLLVGAPEATRDAQVALASVLLWFVLPQVVLYAVGAVATALLQATHRFLAAAAAPVANNVVVVATMVAFVAARGSDAGFALDATDKAILGGGTLLGTVAMTAVVLVAAARAGLPVRPRWRDPSTGPLGDLARQGLWAAGHVGLNQVLVLATVVVAARVEGGVIAFTTAFTLFLLPHALVAHPLVTALTPRLAAQAHRGETAGAAATLAGGLRVLLVLLLPGAALLAALGRPGLQVVAGLGDLDDRGLGLVAVTLAAFATGLVGYSTIFLFTRAAYAVGDVAGPTLVNLGVTASAVAAMAGAAATVDGAGLLVTLGLVQGVALSAGAVVLGWRVRSRTGALPGTLAALGRGAATAAVGGGLAWGVSRAVGFDTRATAVLGALAGAVAGGGAALGALRLLRAPELDAVTARIPGLRARALPGAAP